MTDELSVLVFDEYDVDKAGLFFLASSFLSEKIMGHFTECIHFIRKRNKM